MSEVLVVLCTFPDREQARQIGTALVERQLAACVNLLPAAESIYRWQGKVENTVETLAIIKTSVAIYPGVEQVLAELHPYEVPEIIAFSPERISGAYGDWLLGQLTPRPGG